MRDHKVIEGQSGWGCERGFTYSPRDRWRRNPGSDLGRFRGGSSTDSSLGDHIPGREILAYVAAMPNSGGAAILWRRTAAREHGRLGPSMWSLPSSGCRDSIRRPCAWVFAAPFIGLFVGVGQQVILVAAAAIRPYHSAGAGAVRRREYGPPRLARWTFGLSSIDFGLAHLTGVRAVARWFRSGCRSGADFWVILTGIAFVLAGIAMLCGIPDLLAARLLAMMLLVFSVVVFAPELLLLPTTTSPGARTRTTWLPSERPGYSPSSSQSVEASQQTK